MAKQTAKQKNSTPPAQPAQPPKANGAAGAAPGASSTDEAAGTPPPKATPPKDQGKSLPYRVLSPLDHDNVRYEIGETVSLPHDAAEHLMKNGVVAE